MNAETDTEMDELSTEAAARKAIHYALTQIHNRPEVGWYLNHTQAFALLAEAYSRLSGEDLAKVRETYACPNAKNPAEAATPVTEKHCHAELMEMMVSSDVIDFVEELSIPSRMELLQDLRRQFCADCGAIHRVRFGPCDCHARRRNLRAR